MMIPNIRAALYLIITGALMTAAVLAWAVYAYASSAPTDCVTPDGYPYQTSYPECPPPAGHSISGGERCEGPDVTYHGCVFDMPGLLLPAVPAIVTPEPLLTLPETS